MNLTETKDFVVAVLKGAFTNKSSLDKISENDDGDFLFDGDKIGTKISSEDGNAIVNKTDGIYVSTLSKASDTTLGGVKIDGTTITIDENGVISGSSSIDSLDDIEDVEITDVADGQVVMYDETNSKWINGDIPKIEKIEDIEDVELTDIEDGQTLIWDNENSQWINSDIGATLQDLYYSYEDYSGEEKVIGRYTDGKPIYRKMFILSTPVVVSNSSWTDTNQQLDADYIIKACCLSPGKGYYSLYATKDTSTNTIKLQTGRNTSGVDCKYLTIEYTKTTDAENSFLPSMVTDGKLLPVAPSYDDYSEEEIVIGKWTDGKPVYRQIYNLGEIVINKNITYISISNRDEIEIIANAWLTRESVKQCFCVGCTIPSGDPYLITNDDMGANGNKLLILEYTKTTDEPNSFTPDMIKTIPLVDEVKESDVADILFVLGGN